MRLCVCLCHKIFSCRAELAAALGTGQGKFFFVSLQPLLLVFPIFSSLRLFKFECQLGPFKAVQVLCRCCAVALGPPGSLGQKGSFSLVWHLEPPWGWTSSKNIVILMFCFEILWWQRPLVIFQLFFKMIPGVDLIDFSIHNYIFPWFFT